MVNSYLALGYKCNHNCLNCPLSTYDRLHGQLDKEVIDKSISILKSYVGNVHVTISGGEPTLNPYFLDTLRELGSTNAHITILSNATRCRDLAFVDDIIRSLGEEYDFRRFRFITAIHSSNSKVHDMLTGVDNSFNETMAGLSNLDKRNIQIVIKNIMNKVTAPDMEKTMSFLSEYFSNNVDFQYCATDYSGRCAKNLEQLYISNCDLQPYLEDCLDSYEKNKDSCGRRLEVIETPLCLVDPYYWKYFRLEGSDKSLMYIAPNDESENNMSCNTDSMCNTNYRECQGCVVREYCSGVWRSTYDVEEDKGKVLRKVREC